MRLTSVIRTPPWVNKVLMDFATDKPIIKTSQTIVSSAYPMQNYNVTMKSAVQHVTICSMVATYLHFGGNAVILSPDYVALHARSF